MLRKTELISAFKDSFDNVDTDIWLGEENYDIFLKDLNLLISIDFDNSFSYDKYCNMNKTTTAFDDGYHCIHVFSWDDTDKIFQYISPSREVDLSKCIMCGLSRDGARDFYNTNNVTLSYFVEDNAFYYGLYDNRELIFMFAIVKAKGHTILDCMCSKLGVKINNLKSVLEKFGTFTYGCDMSKMDVPYLISEGLQYVSTMEPVIHYGDKRYPVYDCGTAILRGDF